MVRTAPIIEKMFRVRVPGGLCVRPRPGIQSLVPMRDLDPPVAAVQRREAFRIPMVETADDENVITIDSNGPPLPEPNAPSPYAVDGPDRRSIPPPPSSSESADGSSVPWLGTHTGT